jgi:hypothetical protein
MFVVRFSLLVKRLTADENRWTKTHDRCSLFDIRLSMDEN